MNYEFRKMKPEEFDRVFSILTDSFPADEYRDYEKQQKLIENERFSVYVFADKDSIVAFISAWEFDNLFFIEHFAVSESVRNQGIGTALLRNVCTLIKKEICLEVELPETEKARRRIGFYERNGFVLNNYDYEQPAYSEDKSAVPLLIMTYGKSISETRFREIEKILYRYVYEKDGR